MVEMAGTKAVVRSLELEGVRHVFGLPGGVVIPLFDEMLQGDFRLILARHEQGAAHMADGYARATGKVGVCVATSGPGATNLVTGIATANMDSSAVVALTGQVNRAVIGTDAFQEVDIIGCSASVTKYNMQVRRAADIPRAIKSAFYIASTGRKGAVLIDLPKDSTTDVEDVVFPATLRLRGYRPSIRPDPRDVATAAKLLAAAQRPAIVAGGGVINAGASRELVALAEYLMAPTATTLMGKGSIPADHPLSLGMCGMHGTVAANSLVPEADVLLIAGARLSDRTTGAVKSFAPNAKIIHLDIDQSEVDKNVEAMTKVVGDASLSLKGLLAEVARIRASSGAGSDWARKVGKLKCQVNGNGFEPKEGYLRAPKVIQTLRSVLPREAVVTTEVGQCQMWAALHYDAYAPRTFFSSGGLGTMGWGFPASIGVKAARPDIPVVDIAGDGSFGMTENSMATSVEEGLPVVVLVLNNHMLGMVAQWQRLFFGHRYSAVKLNGNPDMVKLAEAYGAEGVRVDSYESLEAAIRRAMKSDVSTVIDVPIDPEENVYPIVPPGMGLRDALLEA